MKSVLTLSHVSDVYRDFLAQVLIEQLFPTVNILIVVDTEISLTPGPAAFGIGRVIDLIRNASAGCMHFSVTLARRSNANPSINPNPAPNQPKYEGFRFDRQEPDGTTNTIDLFDEIWGFGFKPDNFNGPDSNIFQPNALPLSDAELQVLTRWMNERQGGIFATGDHDYLGASMCSRIPRVGTMRLWTNAQGVPPINGSDRIDTNRPATPAQADITGNPAEIPFDNQSDAVPQAIEWVAWSSVWVSPLTVKRRPHPILCHPTHGPINVMPDHPHEGRCFDTAINPATGIAEIELDGTYDFLGYAGDEYPSDGGVRPTPKVIAYGTTLPDPPYNHEKGDSPHKRFPMVSIYDGHQVHIGRVAVDSTWHHWMDINLTGIEAAADKTNWEKISRYFLNLAVWLAPPRIAQKCLLFHLLESHFEYVGLQEFSPRVPLFDLGSVLKNKLKRVFGPCWVTQFVLDWIFVYDVKLHTRLIEHYLAVPERRLPKPKPDPCLTCPPLGLLEEAVLGGMVQQTFDVVTPIRQELGDRLDTQKRFELDVFEKRMREGVACGLHEIARALDASLQYTRELFVTETLRKSEEISLVS